MKKELLNSLKVLNGSLENIDIKGRDNIMNMRDAFTLVEGMFKYVSSLPDEPEPEEEPDEA